MDKKEVYRRTNQFNRENYDQIRLLVKKEGTEIAGGKKAIMDHAQSMGESMNGFINRAIKETMERDNRRNGYVGD